MEPFATRRFIQKNYLSPLGVKGFVIAFMVLMFLVGLLFMSDLPLAGMREKPLGLVGMAFILAIISSFLMWLIAHSPKQINVDKSDITIGSGRGDYKFYKYQSIKKIKFLTERNRRSIYFILQIYFHREEMKAYGLRSASSEAKIRAFIKENDIDVRIV